MNKKETKVQHKWIPEFEGLYSVGTNGAVLSHSRLDVNGRPIRARFLKGSISDTGYPLVALFKDGVQTTEARHRLVAKLFLDNPENYPVVKHLDHNKMNPDVSNLVWDTQQKNAEDSLALYFEFKSPTGKCTKVFNLRKFCRSNNLHCGHMSEVYSGKRKSHKGWSLWVQ